MFFVYFSLKSMDAASGKCLCYSELLLPRLLCERNTNVFDSICFLIALIYVKSQCMGKKN